MSATQQKDSPVKNQPVRHFDPNNIPPALKSIPDDVQFKETATGIVRVRWGWRQWITLAPKLAKHVRLYGRNNLSGLLFTAQKVLPKEQRRTRKAITNQCDNHASPDVLQIIAFASSMQLQHEAIAKDVPKKVPELVTLRELVTAQPHRSNRLAALLDGSLPRDDIPPTMRNIPNDVTHAARGGIRWGWKQFAAVAPAVNAHLKAHGREGLAQALTEAQAGVIPQGYHRDRRTWSVRAAPSSKPDTVELFAFIEALQQDSAPSAAEQLVPQIAAAPVADPQTAQTPDPVPAPAPVAANAPQGDLQAFLATPIGAFMPSVRSFLQDALRDLLTPHRDFIAAVVRQAVIDVVGAPSATPAPTRAEAPAAAAASDPDAAPAQAVETLLQAREVAATAQWSRSDSNGTVDVLYVPHKPEEPASDQEAKPEVKQPRDVAPHDLESQLHAAARALGIAHQVGKRETVVAVGLHPKVEQEVDRFYGKHFRFLFKRPDAFNCANDVPASTDAILLCRKTLTKELVALTRRDALPVVHVQNDSGAVITALRNTFPESVESLNA